MYNTNEETKNLNDIIGFFGIKNNKLECSKSVRKFVKEKLSNNETFSYAEYIETLKESGAEEISMKPFQFNRMLLLIPESVESLDYPSFLSPIYENKSMIKENDIFPVKNNRVMIFPFHSITDKIKYKYNFGENNTWNVTINKKNDGINVGLRPDLSQDDLVSVTINDDRVQKINFYNEFSPDILPSMKDNYK
ncbi:MAG: hypothetical protein ACQER9_02555 [Nanobdellota archaeon]